MKRTLHLLLLTFLSLLTFTSSQAQNQVYWRESFSLSSTVTSDPAAGSTVYTYTGDAGVWTFYGIWSTTGTDCPAPGQATGSNRHIRSTSNTSLGTGTPSVEDDTVYAITPAVNSGIQELHFYRSRTNRRYTIWKTSDIDATTTNWILAAVVEKNAAFPNPTCADTAIVINDGNAKRLRIRFERAGNSDIDSVIMTSVTAILPVKFSGINAVETSGKVKVSWNVATEINTSRYVIERSSNGTDFTEVSTLKATQSSSYTWMDNAPMQGNNLYRIRAIDKDGSSLYTSVVKIALGRKLVELIITPNPVRGGLLNLQISNYEKGNITLSLFNSQGQQVYTGIINHVGGSANQALQLPSSVKAGLYTLRAVSGSDKINRSIVIQ